MKYIITQIKGETYGLDTSITFTNKDDVIEYLLLFSDFKIEKVGA